MKSYPHRYFNLKSRERHNLGANIALLSVQPKNSIAYLPDHEIGGQQLS